jgi:hypothetical protein
MATTQAEMNHVPALEPQQTHPDIQLSFTIPHLPPPTNATVSSPNAHVTIKSHETERIPEEIKRTSGASRSLTTAWAVSENRSARPQKPFSTRMRTARVALACVNCKNKHLACDIARPCCRCVKAGRKVRGNLYRSRKLC